MADFTRAYKRTIVAEGGYQLTNIEGDRGGMTYAGIARRPNPNWVGWQAIDAGQIPSTSDVVAFYKAEFWDKVAGDQLTSESTAATLYDFAVNAGWRTAVKLAQIVVGQTPDGVAGPQTIAAINAADEHTFALAYALAKVRRYSEIVNRDRSQGKFLLGWINRVLENLK